MIDISRWNKRNVWMNSAGDLVVREGMQHTLGAWQLDLKEFYGGFSTENPRTSDQIHYILGANEFNDTYIIMCNEEYYVLAKKYVGKGLRPIGPFQGGVLANGQILMGAPGMPMYWGYVGNDFKVAQRTVTSADVDFTTLSLNDGLVVSWQGRAVLGVRDALFFSDPGDPRAFLAANVVSTPGFVYFLQVSEAGSLYMGTTEGVYQIAVDTSYSGEIVQPSFQKVSEYPINGFYQCCSSPKGPVSLSRHGIVSVSSYDSVELPLGDQRITRTVAPPVHFEDYRKGKIFAGKEGPIISMASEQDQESSTYLMLRVDEARGIFSWNESAEEAGFKESIEIRGLLYDSDGTEYLLTENSVFKFFGNVDTLGDKPVGRYVIGSVAGNVPVDPQANPVVRSITSSSDNDGTRQIVSIQGIQKEAQPSRAYKVVVQTAAGPPPVYETQTINEIPIVDETEWYDTAPNEAAKRYYTRRLQSVRHLFSIRTNDIAIELSVEGSGFRLGLVSLTTKGPGRYRPQDGKNPPFPTLGLS